MRDCFAGSRFRVAALGLLAVAVATAGCGGSSKSPTKSTTSKPASTAPPSTGPTSTSLTTTTPTTLARSAATDLARYFTGAGAGDARLRTAAAAVNAAIGTTQVTVDQSTLVAIDASDPAQVAALIPAGLTSSVLLPVLTVQSDLVSRYSSLRGFRLNLANPGQPRTFPLSDVNVERTLTCLRAGAPAAASFSADLAAARDAAVNAPPVVAQDPASRAAADLAIRLERIKLLNQGGAGCGGSRVTSLAAISWHHVDAAHGDGREWDGDIAGLLFAATYRPDGWHVLFHAN